MGEETIKGKSKINRNKKIGKKVNMHLTLKKKASILTVDHIKLSIYK